MKLNLNVQNQTLMRHDAHAVVSDSVKYLEASFSFETADWNNTTKTAVFKSGNLTKIVILDGNNECKVPYEVIDAGYLYVSVFGTKADGYRITTNACMVQIEKSGDLEGDDPLEVTPSQYEQITGALAGKIDVEALDGTSIYQDETGKIHAAGGSGSGASWGNIAGNLNNQTDLKNALEAKANASNTYTKTEVDTAIQTAIESITEAEGQEV